MLLRRKRENDDEKNEKSSEEKSGFHKKVRIDCDPVDNVVSIKDFMVADGIKEESDKIQIGRYWCRIFAVPVYPQNLWVGWLDDLFSLGDLDVSVHIEPYPPAKAVKNLGKKLTAVLSQLMHAQKTGNIAEVPKLKAASQDLNALMEAIQNNREKIYFCTLFIALYAEDVGLLNEKTKTLEDMLARKNCIARTLMFRQLDGFKGTLPLGMLPFADYDRNLTSGGVTCMMPISNPDLSHDSGIFLGRNLFTGAPVFYDRFDRRYLPNQHLAVFGITGSGKSVTLKLITTRSVISGIRTVVLDPEREYRNSIKELLGGEYVTIKAGRPTGINLLDLNPMMDENGQMVVDISEKIIDVRSIFSAIARNYMGRPLSPLEISALEEVLTELYKERGITNDPASLYEEKDEIGNGVYTVGLTKKQMPTLTELREKLAQKENAKELAEVLKPFCAGGTLSMFDCQTTVNLESHVVGFDLKEIRDEFTKFYASLVILSWIWNKMAEMGSRERKSIVIDEGWMFAKYPETALFLETTARRGRKYGISLIVASQFIDEFISREEGRAVINSCASLILMRQHPNSVEKIVDAFRLSSGCIQLLETFRPGECIFSLNGATTAIRIEPTIYEWNYVTTGIV